MGLGEEVQSGAMADESKTALVFLLASLTCTPVFATVILANLAGAFLIHVLFWFLVYFGF